MQVGRFCCNVLQYFDLHFVQDWRKGAGFGWNLRFFKNFHYHKIQGSTHFVTILWAKEQFLVIEISKTSITLKNLNTKSTKSISTLKSPRLPESSLKISLETCVTNKNCVFNTEANLQDDFVNNVNASQFTVQTQIF